MTKETMAGVFGNQPPLTGVALKNENFINFIERLAAYRDEQHGEACRRRYKRLAALDLYIEEALAGIAKDFRADLNKAHEFFEMHQELTERRAEHILLKGLPLKSGEHLAAMVRPHVNDAYSRALAKAAH